MTGTPLPSPASDAAFRTLRQSCLFHLTKALRKKKQIAREVVGGGAEEGGSCLPVTDSWFSVQKVRNDHPVQ